MKQTMLAKVGRVLIHWIAVATLYASPLEVGSPFPDLALPAIDDGRPVSVHDFRGRKLIVHIWASW